MGNCSQLVTVKYLLAMSSLEKIEEYFHTAEGYFYSSVSAVTENLPDVHHVANKLWIDISRYGPGLPAFPEVHMPSLGDFQVPPPPPPPPPVQVLPHGLVWSLVDWSCENPKKASGIVVGVVGTGLLIGYRATRRSARGQPRSRVPSQRAAAAQSGERRQAVVVLGGDTPYGVALITDLEKKGYIVIASVSTPEAVEVLESRTKGYVKALVLDPHEPATVPLFLRSLSSTLSRKFPLKASGDPYSSPASQPYIQSVVSLLTLPSSYSSDTTTSSSPSPTLGPLEHLSLAQDYLPYLNATQISPLQVIQQLLPLLRTGSARSVDKGRKSIIICLPAVDTHVALPFSAVRAMSAAGTLKAVEILRREIAMAAATGKTDAMKNIRVVTVDVGSVDLGKGAFTSTTTAAAEETSNMLSATDGWTSSEKLIYGPAFASVAQSVQQRALGLEALGAWEGLKALFGEKRHYAVGRKPAEMSAFVDTVVGIISAGRFGVLGHHVGLGFVMNWVRGDRISVGAGANTYKLASYLPSLLLDGLLNLPYFLIGVRNRLLPVQPHRIPPRNLPSARSNPRSGGKSTSTPSSATSNSAAASRQDFGQRSIAAAPYGAPRPSATATTPPPLAEDEVPEEQKKAEEEVEEEEEEDVGSEPDSAPVSSQASVASSWVDLDERASY